MTHRTRSYRRNLDGAIAGLTFTVLLLLSSTSSSLPVLHPVGQLSLGLALTLLSMLGIGRLAIYQTLPRRLTPFVLSASVFVLVYLLRSISEEPAPRGVPAALQAFLVLNTILGATLVLRGRWRAPFLRIGALAAIVFTSGNLLYWTATGMPYLFAGYFLHPNVLGAYTLYLLFYPLALLREGTSPLARAAWRWCVFAAIPLLIATGSRSVWLTGTVIVMSYLGWGVIIRRRWRFALMPIFLIVSIVAGTYMYVRLPGTDAGRWLNERTVAYTGQNFFSGRDRLWPTLLDAAEAKPIIGYGADALPKDFLETGQSSHNLYLQIALQVGLVGLLAFLAVISSLWGALWRIRHHPVARLSGAYLVGILVHQMFEVTLTQNNLAIGLLQWLTTAAGVALAVRPRRLLQEVPR